MIVIYIYNFTNNVNNVISIKFTSLFLINLKYYIFMN